MSKDYFQMREDTKYSSVPDVTFHTRVRDESVGGDNPYKWEQVKTDELFKDKKVLMFSLPGAFTPTCSTYQLPDYEKLSKEFKKRGIDEIYCVSVNDSFVMNKWAKDLGVKNIKMIPDGSGKFTEGMRMMVRKDNLGFGPRSWRYASIVEDGKITQMFEEPGKMNDCPDDPYGESSPQNVLKKMKKL